ncbi:MAG: TolC family protein [Planctomycetes bacterium]|nr:TolC family protein [Planctomycetota bacterium]
MAGACLVVGCAGSSANRPPRVAAVSPPVIERPELALPPAATANVAPLEQRVTVALAQAPAPSTPQPASTVAQTSLIVAAPQPQSPSGIALVAPTPPPEPVPAPPAESSPREYPIDLVTTLRLADGSNLQVAVAREQIRQAWAQYQGSRVLWLPSLRGGLNYNRHDGPIQNINGTILPVSRSLFYSGLGAGAAGAGSPILPGLYANFDLADAIFQPLATRQTALAQRHAAAATTNDMLLRVSQGYLELLRAAEDIAIADEAQQNAQYLFDLTSTYAQSGQGLRADADRAEAELSLRKNDLLRAQENLRVTSARLAQLLRLDPTVQLAPLDDTIVPLNLVPAEASLHELVAQGLTLRPEIGQNRHLVAAAVARMRREQYAPLVPSVLVGASYGTFGGGQNASVSGFGGRFDADAVAWWELRNLGFGDAAARSQTRSVVRQANEQQLATMDLVAREVVEAHTQVAARLAQIETARLGVEAAKASHERNVARIRDVQGLPIEVLQSNQALTGARREYLRAMIDYNLAQFALYRAIGWPAMPAAIDPPAKAS